MTKIIIFEKNEKIWAFQIKGHSGYAPEQSDIVCSAISTASQMTVQGLTEILKLNAKVDMADGYMRVELDDKSAQSKEGQLLLVNMTKTLEEISKQYPKNVKMEVRKDVY